MKHLLWSQGTQVRLMEHNLKCGSRYMELAPQLFNLHQRSPLLVWSSDSPYPGGCLPLAVLSSLYSFHICIQSAFCIYTFT